MAILSRSTVLRAAGVALGVFLAVPAGATSMVKLTTNQLIDASDAVIRGTVTDVWTELDSNGTVWTRASVDITEVLKGDPDLSAVVVDEEGGIWGGASTWTEGVARFSVGEDAVFFLETLGSGHTMPVGLFQGKFTIQVDPYQRTEIVHRYAPDLDRPFDARFIPLPDAADRVRLDNFEDQIRARVASGWDGQPIPGASDARLHRINRLAAGVK